MARQFNSVGPCFREHHYLLEAKERLPQVKTLIQQGNYFGVYGPRRTGKTTAMQLWAADLTQKSAYAAVLVSAATASVSSYEEAIAEDAFLYALREAAHSLPEELRPPDWGYQVEGQRIRAALTAWTEACPRPLVIFIDDIDTLEERPLTSLLRQLWGGYQHRPQRFPQSVALIGLSPVEQLPLAWGKRSGRQEWMTPGSLVRKFQSTTLTVQAFTLEEVVNLYQQHTNTTGQLFTLEAVDRAFELTQGGPWLVNALAQHVITDTDEPIDSIHIEGAIHSLQPQQPTDHFTSRLWESRLQSILEPVLMGQPLTQCSPDDLGYAIALGLCRLDAQGGVQIANPLYQEMIVQQLGMPAIASLGALKSDGLPPDDALDQTQQAEQIWQSFSTYWQQMGDELLATVAYSAIAPYLAIIAFFHRVTQPNGTLEKDYDFSHDQMQLVVRLDALVLAIHMVVWRDSMPAPPDSHTADSIDLGVIQLDQLLNRISSQHGGLIIIDQRRDRRPCGERSSRGRATTPSGHSIVAIRG